jgi:hypothetical protein
MDAEAVKQCQPRSDSRPSRPAGRQPHYSASRIARTEVPAGLDRDNPQFSAQTDQCPPPFSALVRENGRSWISSHWHRRRNRRRLRSDWHQSRMVDLRERQVAFNFINTGSWPLPPLKLPSLNLSKISTIPVDVFVQNVDRGRSDSRDRAVPSLLPKI